MNSGSKVYSHIRNDLDSEITNLQVRIDDLTEVLYQRDQTIADYKEELKETKEKLVKFEMDSNYFHSTNPFKQKSSVAKNFPSVDKVPRDQLKVTYSTLNKENSSLYNEKETLLAALKDEQIQSEKQKNYIEMLQQTIESSLIKHGLVEAFEKEKNKNYPTDADVLDAVIDFAMMRQEIEELVKQQNEKDMVTDELRLENDRLRTELNKHHQERDRMKMTVSSGLVDLNSMKEEFEVKKKENDDLRLEIEQLVADFNKLSDAYEKIYGENDVLRTEVDRKKFKIEELEDKLVNFDMMAVKMKEIKDEFAAKEDEVAKAVEEKKLLEDTKGKLEVKVKELEYKEQSLSKQLMDKSDEADFLERKLKDEGRRLEETSNSYDAYYGLYMETKDELFRTSGKLKNATNELDNSEYIRKELEVSNKNTKEHLALLGKESIALKSEVDRLSKEIRYIREENDKKGRTLEVKGSDLDYTSNQLRYLETEYNTLKKKHDSAIFEKNEEINVLLDEINIYKREVQALSKQNDDTRLYSDYARAENIAMKEKMDDLIKAFEMEKEIIERRSLETSRKNISEKGHIDGKLAELERKIFSLTDENQQIKKKLMGAENEVETQVKANKIMRSNYEALEEKLSNLKNHNEKVYF